MKGLLDDILDAEGCQWNVVWFNVGNWDITPADARFIRKKPDWGFVEGKPKTSIPEYEKNMAEIIRRIRQHSPDVQVVFTTTTFIPRVGAAGVEAFSHAAVKVMERTAFQFSTSTPQRNRTLDCCCIRTTRISQRWPTRRRLSALT